MNSKETVIKALKKELNEHLKKVKMLTDFLAAYGEEAPVLDQKMIPDNADAPVRERNWHVKSPLSKYVARKIYEHKAGDATEHFLIEAAKMARVEVRETLGYEKGVRNAIRSMVEAKIIVKGRKGYKFTEHGTKQYRLWKKRQTKKAMKQEAAS